MSRKKDFSDCGASPSSLLFLWCRVAFIKNLSQEKPGTLAAATPAAAKPATPKPPAPKESVGVEKSDQTRSGSYEWTEVVGRCKKSAVHPFQLDIPPKKDFSPPRSDEKAVERPAKAAVSERAAMQQRSKE